MQVDRPSDAAVLLVRAAETAPSSAEKDMLMLLGLLPDPQLVIRVFDEALASEERSDEVRLRLLRTAGDYCLHNQCPREAVGFYEKALEVEGGDLDLLRRATVACAAAREYDRGIALCRNFLQVAEDPGAEAAKDVVGRLAAFYETAGRAAEGAEYFISLQGRAPDNEYLCKLLVLLLDRADRKTDAVERAGAFAEGHPKALDVRLVLAGLHWKTDPEKAEAIFRDVVRADPALWQARTALAQVLWESDRRTEAFKVLRDFLVDSPTGPGARRVRMCLAEFLEQSGEHEEAVAELKINLEERPGDPETCNHLGYVYAERGAELEEAVALIRTALRADPANAAYLDSMAWAYYKLGLRDDNPTRVRAAAVLIRKAVILQPNDPILTDHLGDVCFVEGLWEEAVRSWQEAIQAAEESDDDLLNMDAVRAKLTTVQEMIEQGQPGPRPLSRPLRPPPGPSEE